MKKDIYRYFAVFDYADDGISVHFPGLEGCLTCGQTADEAVAMAQDALAGYLLSLEDDDETIPEPPDARSIALLPGQSLVLIEAIMPLFRQASQQQAVKKTLTIPQWLDELAKSRHINFSAVLQEALRQKLSV